jgi:major vault protein
MENSTMEERRPRERELVLAPNEYAYILDTTKGHINCYVGPNKTSLAQTDELVTFNKHTKRFERAHDMERATELFATAPANWYLILKNPAKENVHPSPGSASSITELQVGRKIVIPGPNSFALWPGQMAKVVEGHRLGPNEYLVVQIHDAEQAQKHWQSAVGLQSPDTSEPTLATGDKFIIRGSDVSFFIPPTGVEVVADAKGRYVREAVTLERLEYCIVVGEDGRKRYLRGESVVFPEPNQYFIENKTGQCKFKAIELSDTTGIYIKVVAPYEDTDGAHVEGEELFLTGSSKIYFPREEHALIRYDGEEVHHAIAVPRGEARYLLDRQSGIVRLVEGPTMLLPDPRREVSVRRLLNDRECRLMFPGNQKVLEYNRFLATGKAQPQSAVDNSLKDEEESISSAHIESTDQNEVLGRKFVTPRVITLGSAYDGALSLEIWAGYAIQIKNKLGERRIVKGPTSVRLEYDETVEALQLSTGTPKSTHQLLETAFLQLEGNGVSDRVEVTTSDLVSAKLALKYRVSFEGEGDTKWFCVDNYVQLLCDHAGSKIKSAIRKLSIQQLQQDLTDVVRDAILGTKTESGQRLGLAFDENDMRVYDVEVLNLQIVDDEVAALLQKAQLETIESNVDLVQKETALAKELRTQEIQRQMAQERAKTHQAVFELEQKQQERAFLAQRADEERLVQLQELSRERDRRWAELDTTIKGIKRTDKEAEHRMRLEHKSQWQDLSIQEFNTRVEGAVRQGAAFSPHLVTALNRMGDEQFLTALTENFSELAAVEGRGILATAKKFMDFIPANFAPQLKPDGDHRDDDV